MRLPEPFRARVVRELGEEEGQALCRALDTEACVSVRLNPAKECPTPSDDRVPWCTGGYYLPCRPAFTLDTAFHAGAYYVQEASSQFVGWLLRNEELRGGRVLDSAPPRAARRRSMPRLSGRTDWSSPTKSTGGACRHWPTTSASGAQAIRS